MADPTPASPAGAAPESSDALATAENAAGTAGRFADAARTAAESVRNDAVTLVGKDVSVGARLEAGLNIAADVPSFVVGPEDAVAERAVVFGVKEVVGHAVDAVESWQPSMPFEKFGSLMAHIRGGSPTPTPTPDQAHTLAKTQAQQQSIGR